MMLKQPMEMLLLISWHNLKQTLHRWTIKNQIRKREVVVLKKTKEQEKDHDIGNIVLIEADLVIEKDDRRETGQETDIETDLVIEKDIDHEIVIGNVHDRGTEIDQTKDIEIDHEKENDQENETDPEIEIEITVPIDIRRKKILNSMKIQFQEK